MVWSMAASCKKSCTSMAAKHLSMNSLQETVPNAK